MCDLAVIPIGPNICGRAELMNNLYRTLNNPVYISKFAEKTNWFIAKEKTNVEMKQACSISLKVGNSEV